MSDKKTILVRDYPNFAGSWIYNAYARAWESLGYDVERWTSLDEHYVDGKQLMITTSDIMLHRRSEGFLDFLHRFEKVYMWVTPTKFPQPWARHPNFIDSVGRNIEFVRQLNGIENVVKWTFCNVNKRPEFWKAWDKVHYVPLAYDHLGYEVIEDEKWTFDAAYVGSWADNGFNTKKKIMKVHFSAFKNSDLKCGFFINKNLTHEQECKLLSNSKVCINIHDDYQRELHLDTNERTFKTLGLNGLLVSDTVGEVIPDYPGVWQTDSPEEMVAMVKHVIGNLEAIDRETTKKRILENDTYVNRCKQLEKL